MRRAVTDSGCFTLIFDRYFVTIHRYVARRCGQDVADDIAGEVFRIAFERRLDFDMSAASARPWLYGIAANLLRTRQRSEQRRLRAMQRTFTADGAAEPIDVYERSAEYLDASAAVRLVPAALLSLPERDREALVLFAVEGLTYAEVAEALGLPVGTVRSRISRARSRLRELLDHGGQRPTDRCKAEDAQHG